MIPQYEEMINAYDGFFQGLKDVKKTLEHFSSQLSWVETINSQTDDQLPDLSNTSLKISTLLQETKASMVSQLDKLQSQLN